MRRAAAPRAPAGWRLAPLALGAVLAGCDGPSPASAAAGLMGPRALETEQRLYGTWVRESVTDGVQSRRVLRLHPDGAFQEEVRTVDAQGRVARHLHAGTWLFDGTNFKRRYTLMNGQPPSRRNLPFATFQIRFESRNEFVGEDHIHRNRIRYWRAQPEVQL